MSDLPPLPEGFRLVENSPLPPLPSGFRLLDQAPAAAPDQPTERSYALSEVPAQALGNFVPSLGKQIGEMVEGVTHAVKHPIDTASALARLGISTFPGLSDVIQGGADFASKISPKDSEKIVSLMRWLNEPKNAIRDDLTKTYGSWENVKRTLAEDPARVLMDAATIASGGEMALARAPGVAGTVGRAAGRVADALDPISVAAKGVKAVGEPLMTGWLGTNTGVGSAPLREAARSGFVGGEEGSNFRRAFRGDVPPEEIVTAASDGVQHLKQEMQWIYNVRRNDPRHGWANDPTQINFQPIRDAWRDVVNSLTTRSGMRKVGDAEWNQIQRVGDVISEWDRNPALRTPEEIDALKQRIRAIYPDGEAPQLRRVVTRMSNAVGNEIKNQVPGYARAMRDYHLASDHLWELEKAFALGEKSSMQTSLSKLQSVMRNNASTQYGLRDRFLTDIEDRGFTSVRPYLAGSSLGTWEPRSLARITASAGLPAAASALALGLPGAAAAAGAGFLTSIPKVVGGAYHGAGRLAGLPDRAAEMVAGRLGRPAPHAGFFYDAFGRTPRLGARLLPDEGEGYSRGGFFS